MLLIADSFRQLDFAKLMEVYAQGNGENGAEKYPELSAGEQLLQAEQDFYQYLRQGFFLQPGDRYCIWQEDGRYISALRLQSYRDGLLLEALETRPDCRRQGYGEGLIRAVQGLIGDKKLYSHISHRNAASQAIHQKCGFVKISDMARYADGSVNGFCGTYLYHKSAG